MKIKREKNRIAYGLGEYMKKMIKAHYAEAWKGVGIQRIRWIIHRKENESEIKKVKRKREKKAKEKKRERKKRKKNQNQKRKLKKRK